ncbi:hypothetical protein A4G99_20030 [Haladaptatus sp. R4]|uniref:TetR/AcrR family transcriptional regulator n=1 Tax=Haladaptatus sp. R4 TaxID=1679489 RepID=UPI0007B4670D|nr:TetR/AcrR family transcriptional regulator [Haladaptatus sp. R4]KZN22523.1 hypothetical protein A4G99_20030 [Haladaptatus sp. R4]
MHNFSDEEREEIREQLIETAQELFTLLSYQKTTIEDITEPVGIAKSTFYRFFDTKGEIYVEVLHRQQDGVIDVVEAELKELQAPERQLERLFQTWTTEFEKRPLLLRSHEAPLEILREVDAQKVEEVKANVIRRIAPLIEDIQARCDGLIRDLTPEMVIELLSVLELVVAQKEGHESYGWSGYSQFKDSLIRIFILGLLSEGWVNDPAGNTESD